MSSLMEFVNHLSCQHSDIEFTVQHSRPDVTSSVPYLDLSISVTDCRLEWELFVKESHSGVHLSYCSGLPMDVKMAVARNQFRRANINSSNERMRGRSEEKIEKLLLVNGYPAEMVRRARKPRQESNTKKRSEKSAVCPTVKLPYVNDRLCRDVRRIVKSYSKGVRLVFTSGSSLKEMLVTSSFVRPVCPREQQRQLAIKKRGKPAECRACDAGLLNGDCLSKNVVYSMCCSICDDEYVGETERPLRVRFQEHYLQARNRAVRAPWGQHFKHNHPDVLAKEFTPFKNARLRDRQRAYPNRMVAEAVNIRCRKPAVNNDSGWHLL